MNIIQDTIKLLDIDPEFIVKPTTAYSACLTVLDMVSTIVNDTGNSTINILFKGHDLPKIRSILRDLFIDHPKQSNSATWYLHILKLNGLKKCPCCDEIKPLSSFSKNKAKKSSGVDSWCLVCSYALRNINSEYIKNIKADHQKNNASVYAAASAKRRASKLNATPTWANLDSIQQIYDNCPDGYHVDHWAPLQGENVCGLHVEYNLQYLKALDNISKSNSFSDTDVYYGY